MAGGSSSCRRLPSLANLPVSMPSVPTPIPTMLEEWVVRTMIATYGLFAILGIVAFPASIVLGHFVFTSLSDIFSAVWHGGIQRLDLFSCFVLIGVALFFWDLLMLVQFWRFAFGRSTLFAPVTLWTMSVCSMIAWIAWFLFGAHSVGWLAQPGFFVFSLCFLMWPLVGIILSATALFGRMRKG